MAIRPIPARKRRPSVALVGFGLAAVLAGCRHAADLDPPPVRDLFGRYLTEHATLPGSLSECPSSPGTTEPMAHVAMRRLKLSLSLPADFVAGPINLPIDSLVHPVLGRWGGQQWLPGLYLQPVTWYRWTRVRRGSGTAGEAPTTVFQLGQRRGYIPFVAEPPWTVSSGRECRLTLGDRTIRVLLFNLVHPSLPTQWGVEAFWRGRPDDGWLAALGLGPEERDRDQLVSAIRGSVP